MRAGKLLKAGGGSRSSADVEVEPNVGKGLAIFGWMIAVVIAAHFSATYVLIAAAGYWPALFLIKRNYF